MNIRAIWRWEQRNNDCTVSVVFLTEERNYKGLGIGNGETLVDASLCAVINASDEAGIVGDDIAFLAKVIAVQIKNEVKRDSKNLELREHD